MKCIICDKNIPDGDIFMMIKIDMRRLIYNTFESENNFLVPDGPVHSTATLVLCENCGSKDMMLSASKDMATALSHIR